MLDGIELINDKNLADIIIIARGGGSLEDLWPFNEEIVARAIYNSKLPIISAIGHETDFTIADFVADLRAPTPSAAAELAVGSVFDLKVNINNLTNRLRTGLRRKTDIIKLRYEKCMASRVYTNPVQNINDLYIRIDKCIKSLEGSSKSKIQTTKTSFVKIVSKLDTLSPLKTLTRGYCITQTNGKIVKSSKELDKDDSVDLRFYDGYKQAKIL